MLNQHCLNYNQKQNVSPVAYFEEVGHRGALAVGYGDRHGIEGSRRSATDEERVESAGLALVVYVN